jgi:hypothetical protein
MTSNPTFPSFISIPKLFGGSFTRGEGQACSKSIFYVLARLPVINAVSKGSWRYGTND